MSVSSFFSSMTSPYEIFSDNPVISAIMLARLRMSHSSVREAILYLDDSRLSIDNLKAIKQNAPTPDEVSKRQFSFKFMLKCGREDRGNSGLRWRYWHALS